VVYVFAVVVLFFTIDQQSIYFLDTLGAITIIVGGIMMFFAYLAYHRQKWGFITWIGWLVWAVPSFFLNAATDQHFIRASDFTRVPPVMVQIAPYVGAFAPIFALTSLVFLTDFIWSADGRR
jgi:hypothetical protein